MCFLFLNGTYVSISLKVFMYSQLKNYIGRECSTDNKSKTRMSYQQAILGEEKAGNHFYIPGISKNPSHREE